eukprot:tig00000441_g715.t1
MAGKENLAVGLNRVDDSDEEEVGVRKNRRARRVVVSDDEDDAPTPQLPAPQIASSAADDTPTVFSFASLAAALPAVSQPAAPTQTPARPVPLVGPEDIEEPASAWKSLADDFAAELGLAASDEEEYGTPPELNTAGDAVPAATAASDSAPRSLADQLAATLDEESDGEPIGGGRPAMAARASPAPNPVKPAAVKREPASGPGAVQGVIVVDSDDDDSESSPEKQMQNDEECSVCDRGGEILMCDSCPRSYHLECIDLEAVPDCEEWSCPVCLGDFEMVHDRRAAALAEREARAAREMREPAVDPGAASDQDDESEPEAEAEGGRPAPAPAAAYASESAEEEEEAGPVRQERRGPAPRGGLEAIAQHRAQQRAGGVRRAPEPAPRSRPAPCLADQIAANCDAEDSDEERAVEAAAARVRRGASAEDEDEDYVAESGSDAGSGDGGFVADEADEEEEYESSGADSDASRGREKARKKKGQEAAKAEEVMFGGGGFATEKIDQTWVEDEDGDWGLEGEADYSLPRKIHERLFPYQREGVAWLFGLHKERKGALLGDDMGLGKTVTLLSFLHGLFFRQLARCVLLVCPKSLLEHWRQKAGKWCRLARVFQIHGGSIPGRQKAVRELLVAAGAGKPCIALTTFETLASRPDVFAMPPVAGKGGRWTNDSEEYADEDELAEARDPSLLHKIKWDVVACDEAHLLKNPATARSQGVRAVRARHRVLLTGTPIQNNLRELWALFSVVQPELLGGGRSFAAEFNNPIERACVSDSSNWEKALGNERSIMLRERIRPHFLRREKVKILRGPDGEGAPAEAGAPTSTNVNAPSSLPKKNDLIIWLPLSPDQERIYRSFLSLPEVEQLLLRLGEGDTRSALPKLTVMKKICDHPRLLLRAPETAAARRRRQAALHEACRRAEAAAEEGADAAEGYLDEDEEGGEAPADLVEALEIDTSADAEVILEQSAKLRFTVQLVRRLADEGHKVLVFARYVRMLDILHRALADAGVRLLRVDGSVKEPAERQRLIDKFNGRKSITAFLLSTQVGGLGFTLTGADRVIIFDPSWNPSCDNQAVDRAYRIGQTRDVVVYRLLTCNTIEEKIYRRQVFKEGLNRTALEKENQFRYFSFANLRNLFELEDTSTSPTQLQLAATHGGQRAPGPELEAHLAFLATLGIFGTSEHDLLFSKEAEAVDDEAARAHARRPPERRDPAAAEAHGFASPAPVPRREKPAASGKRRGKGGAGAGGTPWKGAPVSSLLEGASGALQSAPVDPATKAPAPALFSARSFLTGRRRQAAVEEDLKNALAALRF